MSTVIRVEHVSKRYRLGMINRRMLYEDLRRKWARFWGKEDPYAKVDGQKPGRLDEHNEIWALKDVSFEVNEGDVIGIIGRNGSGKSTLLKILSKITAPTEGRALLKGRVASLLEVGTGFHSELSGRDNVYMNASILGMTKAEIDGRFDEIVDFAGVEKFIDTPVKRYSSGMMVRLAFAVAAHLEPEILIIDEVLAVGDSAFQQKCLGRMSTVAREGRTILFVSHQAAAVENLCRRGIVLENGTLKFDGTQTEAIHYYVNSFTQSTGCLRDRTDRRGSGQLRITSAEWRDTNGRTISVVHAGQDVDLCLFYENHAPSLSWPGLWVSVLVKSELDMPIFTHTNLITGESFPSPLPERGAFVCRLRQLPIPEASFRVSYEIGTSPNGATILDSMENALELRIEGGDFFDSGQLPPIHSGVALVKGNWSVETDATPSTAPAEAKVSVS